MYKPYKSRAAHRLLTTLLYGSFSHLVPPSHDTGIWQLRSIRKLARTLGTESKHVNRQLVYLYDQGYLTYLKWSEDRRQVEYKLRLPPNVRHN